MPSVSRLSLLLGAARVRHPASGLASHLAIQPQYRSGHTVFLQGVRSIVFDVRLMGSGEHWASQIHIVLLLGLVPLDVEDALLTRLQVLCAPLCLEHRREGRVVDMADVEP